MSHKSDDIFYKSDYENQVRMDNLLIPEENVGTLKKCQISELICITF